MIRADGTALRKIVANAGADVKNRYVTFVSVRESLWPDDSDSIKLVNIGITRIHCLNRINICPHLAAICSHGSIPVGQD